jgi:predicted amidophosphoribosyltransferase
VAEFGGLPLSWGGAYSGALRNVLLAAKERQAWGMVGILGDVLADAVLQLLPERANAPPLAGYVVGLPTPTSSGVSTSLGVRPTPKVGSSCLLVPVPTAKAHARERGIDFTRMLSHRATRRLRAAGFDARVTDGLGFTRKPRDQSELNARQRQENLRHAFRWRGQSPRAAVIVIDDIFTTGATLGEALRATHATGAIVLGAACVARTPWKP